MTQPTCRLPRPHAFSLTELLVALVVVAILSTAIAAMLQGAALCNSAVTSMVSAQWEIDTALRRIILETRFCTALSNPNSTTPGTTLALTSQSDVNNGNLSYAITYSQITAADGTKQLQENDPRYGNSILIHDLQTLDFHLQNAGSPLILVITITAGKSPNTVSRTLSLVPRNL